MLPSERPNTCPEPHIGQCEVSMGSPGSCATRRNPSCSCIPASLLMMLSSLQGARSQVAGLQACLLRCGKEAIRPARRNTMSMIDPRPGDFAVVNTGTPRITSLIRLGERLAGGHSTPWDHAAICSDVRTHGTAMIVE